MRFLVVDDDAVDRLATVGTLKTIQDDVVVREAADGSEALTALAEEDYDCIILDYPFTGDSRQILVDARARGDAAVIALTGHGDERLAADAIKAGAVDYLSKSDLTPEALAQAVSGAIRLRRAERAARDSEQELQAIELRFRQVAESSLIGIVFFGVDGAVVGANDAFLELIGYSRDELGAGRINWHSLTPPEYAGLDREMIATLQSTGSCPVFEKEYIRKDGSRVCVLMHGTLPLSGDSPGLAFVLDITERKRAERSLSFLAEAGRIIASTLDFRTTLNSIAHLAVTHIADLCTIDMVEGDEIRRLVVAHADPETEARVRDVLLDNPPDPARDHPVARVIETGETEFSSEPDAQLLDRIARSAEHAEALRGLAFSSYIVVPLTARGRTIGAVSLIGTRGRRSFDDQDRIVAEELARRAAVSIDNARLYESAQAEVHERRFLTESIPTIAWSSGPGGVVDYTNQRFTDYTGMPTDEIVPGGWQRVVHPDDWPDARARYLDSIASGEPYEAQFRVRRGRDGAYRWHLSRATPLHDDAGKIIRWFGTLTDIDDQRRAADGQRFLAEASTFLSSSLDYKTTLTNVVRLAVPTFADWCSVYLVDGDGITMLEAAHKDPEKSELAREFNRRFPPDPAATNGVAEVLRTGRTDIVADITEPLIRASISDPDKLQMVLDLGFRSYICAPLRARDKNIGAITFITAESGRQYGEPDRALAEELALRIALAVDNSRLLAETRARAEQEELVNAIGRKLRSSLDASEIVGLATVEVGRALDVEVATWAWLSADGASLQIAPQRYCAPGATPVTGTYQISGIPGEITSRWLQGKPYVAGDLHADPFVGSATAADATSPRTRAIISHPIFLRGSWAGILAVQQISAPRRWTANEVALVAAISDIVGLALENARIFAREHRVADMLTEAFLSNIPKRLPGIHVETTYNAGLDESRVGGDFYDAYSLPDGRVALVIADVSGKGLSAAVQTASVKYSLRAFAAEAAAPAFVIRRLNHILSRESSGLGEHFVTLFYAVYDPATGRFAYVSAGHETQLLKRVSGEIVQLRATGPILGITDYDFEQCVEYLEPLDTVILFTDGLTEARNSRHELMEIDRVEQLVRTLPDGAPPPVVMSTLVSAAMTWADGRPQDDLALMVVQRELQSDAAPAARGAAGSGERLPRAELLFDFTFPSLPDYATEVRQAVAHWMGTLLYSRLDVEDLQTAVTEAVTNAVRHGSPMGEKDRFTVRGYRREDEALVIEIRDYGPGMAIPTRPSRMPGPDATGGRGLPLMHALSDELEFVPSKDGQMVRLVKRPPALSADK